MIQWKLDYFVHRFFVLSDIFVLNNVYAFKIRAKTNIPNIRIFIRNKQRNIHLSFDSIRVIISHYFGSFWSFWGSGEIFSHKINFYELNHDYKLTILRLLRVTGNIYWLFQINFEKGGVNAYSSKWTSIRIFVRLEKGTFVTFRIFVLALFKIPFYIQLLPDYIQGAAKVLSQCFTMNYM